MNKPQKLASVKLQMLINWIIPDKEFWIPVFSFGRKKTDKYRFRYAFSNIPQALECLTELKQFEGKTLDEFKTELKKLEAKYKKFDYLKVLAKDIKAAIKTIYRI
jgi:hypothetical protein